jgi:putative ABC transport system permease protein
MSALLRWVSFRHVLEAWPRAVLTLCGVALGVAVFVSIRLANHSALASFSATVDAVAGKANLEVSGDAAGFAEHWFPIARATPGVRAATPVIQLYAYAKPGLPATRTVFGSGAGPNARGPYSETLLVLGIDIFSAGPFALYRPGEAVAEKGSGPARAGALALVSSPRAAAVTASFARRHGLRLGDPLTVLASGHPVPLAVRWIVSSPELEQAFAGNVVLVDIATAQDVFGREGRLDRVDLIVDPARRDEVAAALRRRLPPGIEVGPTATRTRQVESMVRAFALNLTALSFIALFVASFLIFNAVSMAVLRRRGELGLLRALGVTRGQATALMLGEGLVYGIAGGLLGLAGGTWLARFTLGAVSRTLTDLYLVREAHRLHADGGSYLAGFGLGLVTAAFSSLAPALEAARTPPALTMRQGQVVEAQHPPRPLLGVAGLAALALSAVASLVTVRARHPEGGFVSAALLLLGFSLAAPAVVVATSRAAEPLLRRVAGISAGLGARDLREAAARTGAIVAALMVAVGMMVALSIMVGSFRRTVATWVGQTIRGDLYVEPVGHRLAAAATALPESFVAAIRRLPDVVAVDTFRGTRIMMRRPGAPAQAAFVAGVDLDVGARYGHLQFVRGTSSQLLERARASGGVLVTESFAHHRRVAAGDILLLDTPAGEARLPVVGVFYDYTTDAGAVLMDESLYARLWGEHRAESLALYLRPGANADSVRARVLAAAGGRLILSIMPNRLLRERVLEVFDQTFQITWALQAIAVLVAVLGVAGALTALILQRGREIGVLRAVGALRRQVQIMVLVESGLLGLCGALLGCVAGLALSLVLVFVINKEFFGWTIRLAVDPWVFARAIALVIVASLLSALGPAWLAATRVAAEALRTE